MKSEKEIKEIIGRKQFWVNEKALKKKLIEEILEGKPRYSVAELEKILNSKEWMHSWDFGYIDNSTNFIEFLKDSKRVQEALK